MNCVEDVSQGGGSEFSLSFAASQLEQVSESVRRANVVGTIVHCAPPQLLQQICTEGDRNSSTFFKCLSCAAAVTGSTGKAATGELESFPRFCFYDDFRKDG